MAGPTPEGGDRLCDQGAGRLKKRADFVRAAKGARVTARAFSLQARKREGDGAGGAAVVPVLLRGAFDIGGGVFFLHGGHG